MSKNRKFWRQNRKSKGFAGGGAVSPLSLALEEKPSKVSEPMNDEDDDNVRKISNADRLPAIQRATEALTRRLFENAPYGMNMPSPGMGMMPPQGMPPQGMRPMPPGSPLQFQQGQQGMMPQGMPPQGMPPQGMMPQGGPPMRFDKGGEVPELLNEPQGGLAQVASANNAPIGGGSPIDYTALMERFKGSSNDPFKQAIGENIIQGLQNQEAIRQKQRELIAGQLKDDKWADAERLFALSAGFAQPTKQKGFAGFLESGAPAISQFAGSKSKAQKERANLELEALKLQGMSPEMIASLSKISDLNEPKNKYEQEAFALFPNDPEKRNQHVKRQIELDIRKRESEITKNTSSLSSLTGLEQKQYLENDGKIDATRLSIDSLKDALGLNEKAFGTYAGLKNTATRIIPEWATPQDWKNKQDATSVLENETIGRALESLRATFGGNPTEGERKILIDLQGSINKTPSERKVIFENLIKQMERRQATLLTQNEKLLGGGYSKSGAKNYKGSGNSKDEGSNRNNLGETPSEQKRMSNNNYSSLSDDEFMKKKPQR